MKIFGFKTHKENKFVHIFCNIVIVGLIVGIGILSLAAPTMMAGSFNDTKAIYNGNTSKNNISLMINIYMGEEYLDSILHTLSENNVKITFFVGGSWAKRKPEYLQRLYDAGQEIGNHGYNHKDHKKLNLTQNQEEIYKTHTLVKEILNSDMSLFAPPSGSYSSTTLEVAKNLGYKTIMWSKDTIDWRDQNVGLIISRATKNLKNGDLILMHPTACTAQALPAIIAAIKQNFNIVTVSENIAP